MKNCARKLAMVAILAGAVMTTTMARVPTSSINGIVTDPHQTVVNGATISATEIATGVTHETLASADGLCVFSGLPAGTYGVLLQVARFDG
jgi:hypothetical protein